MSKPPAGRQPEPMDREVERLLAQLAHFGPQPAALQEPLSRIPAPRPVIRPRSSGVAPSIATPTRRDLVALWARVLLGVALGGLMTQWPYPHGCGLALLGYFGAIFIVMLTAAWIGFASWKLRSGLTHVLALILYFWGVVLAAEQVLPRIGYAANLASWQCSAEAPVNQTAAALSTPR